MRDFFGTRNTFSKSTGVGSRFSVHYVEMDHHDHNYYARSDEINADAWKFLKQNALPTSGAERQLK